MVYTGGLLQHSWLVSMDMGMVQGHGHIRQCANHFAVICPAVKTVLTGYLQQKEGYGNDEYHHHHAQQMSEVQVVRDGIEGGQADANFLLVLDPS